MTKDNINIIDVKHLSEEDRNLVFSNKKVHVSDKQACPQCRLNTITEETMGYEKVVYCTACEYGSSITI
jgi:formamidopyrimidine-DNA glycosylase